MSQGHTEIDTSVWTTEDKRTIKLADLDDSHLANIERMLASKRVALALTETPKKNPVTHGMHMKMIDAQLGARHDAIRAEMKSRGLVVS